MVTSDTMSIVRRFTSIFAVVTVSAMLGAAVPAASAGNAVAGTTVTATRSFPKTTTAKRDFLAEHTSTDIESNADWGGIESLDVPQTESQAEKDQKAQEQAKAEAQAQAAQEQAQAQAQTGAQAASPFFRTCQHQRSYGSCECHWSGIGRLCSAVPRLSVCGWRQYSVRLGLLWFRAVGVRPVWCEPASLFWRPDECWNGCRKHCRSSSGGYHRQCSACRDLYWQWYGDQRAESGSGNAGHFAGRVLRWLCDSSCALSEHTVDFLGRILSGIRLFVWKRSSRC